jgi:hypothetical protein
LGTKKSTKFPNSSKNLKPPKKGSKKKEFTAPKYNYSEMADIDVKKDKKIPSYNSSRTTKWSSI